MLIHANYTNKNGLALFITLQYYYTTIRKNVKESNIEY